MSNQPKNRRKDYILTGIIFIILTSFIFIPKIRQYSSMKSNSVKEEEVISEYKSLMDKFKSDPIISDGQEFKTKNYTMKIPSEWKFRINDNPNFSRTITYIMYAQKEMKTRYPAEMSITVMKMKVGEKFKEKRDKYVQDIEKKTNLNLVGIELNNSKKREMFDVYFKDDSINRKYIYTFYQQKDQLYILSMNADSEVFQLLNDDYFNYIKSFEINY